MSDQLELFDNAEYDAFVEKFKPKKTTDDCYTPPEVYDCVRDYVCERWSLDPATIVRPFWPGGDYERFDYPDGCLVLDNPPFSILARIVKFYVRRGIKFFLFSPGMTCLGLTIHGASALFVETSIIYENGAQVATSFLHNLGDRDIIAESCPELNDRLEVVNKRLAKAQKKQVAKLAFPDELVTGAKLKWFAGHHTEFAFRRSDAVFCRALDGYQGSIFGGGYLLTSKAAAEKAAAEKASALRVELSPREKEILDRLEASRENEVE